MSVSKTNANTYVDVQARRKVLDKLASLLKKSLDVRTSVLSLCLLSGLGLAEVGFAQQGASFVKDVEIASSPWTGSNGREIVDLNAPVNKNAARIANPIRQTQALTSTNGASLGNMNASNVLGDSLQDDLIDEPLEDPASYGAPGAIDEPLVDPTTIDSYDSMGVDEPVKAIDSGTRATTTTTPSIPEVAPAETPDNATAAPARLEAIDVTNRSSASQSAPRYPQSSPSKTSNVPNNTGYNSGSNFYSAVPGGYSNNPYSRIGQAEYNPNQFYGGGGNFSVNGYRNTPPAVAYGQNRFGCACNNDGGCGVFGGILQNTQFELSALSMRNPLDFEDAGNAGGGMALNFGTASPVLFGMNLQGGARATFTDYYGTSANGFEREDARGQFFWTAGAYFRAPSYSEGWSGGVVFDSLKESYYRKYNLCQLRSELSYNFSCLGELGFRGAFSLNKKWTDFLKLDDDLTVDAQVKATSYYTMFYRYRGIQGGEFSAFGGCTEYGEGMLGISAEAPISDSFAIKGGTSYLIPKKRGLTNREEETWNISLGLAFYLGGNARNTDEVQKPLFDVADNGSFIQNFLR